MAPWNWLDSVLAAVVVISVTAAALKGFIRELVSLAAAIAGLALAALTYQRGAVWFEDITRSHELALGVAFLVIFLASLLIGAVISWLARKLVKAAGIQWADRILGGAFGLVRGIVVNSVLVMVLVAFTIKPEAVRQSLLVPYVVTGARVIAAAMPAELKNQFRAGFDKFHRALTEQDKKKS